VVTGPEPAEFASATKMGIGEMHAAPSSARMAGCPEIRDAVNWLIF
jgi:hypothetical protein